MQLGGLVGSGGIPYLGWSAWVARRLGVRALRGACLPHAMRWPSRQPAADKGPLDLVDCVRACVLLWW